MSPERHPLLDFELESERYELLHSDLTDWRPDRRDFLRTLGAGLFVLCLVRSDEAEAQQESGGRRGGRRGGGDVPREIAAWIQIKADGTVAAYSGKAEVGQNARTSLAQAVADELRVPTATVDVVLGDTDRVPYDAGTFGSRTTPAMVPQIRRAAAAARERLIELAAEKLVVDRGSLEVGGCEVRHPASGRSVSFGELTGGRKLVEVIDAVQPIRPPADWEEAGVSAPKVDGRAFVTGRHRYASDVALPGMLFGKVLRPPAFGAALKSVDLSAAEAMPGVVAVRDGDFVGVAAKDEPTAAKALDAIKAEWTAPSGDALNDETVFEAFRSSLEGESRPDDLARALDGSDAKVEAEYRIAYIAHAPLEPRAAAATWEDGKVTAWTGTQRPFGVRSELARAFEIPEDRVRVIVPDTGAGYGGKHTGEAAVEAARLAKAAGKPVKVVWTREEEFTWAYARPAGLMKLAAGASKDGRLRAWEFHNANSGGSGLRTPYAAGITNEKQQQADSPLRQGSYRALASTGNHFARESMMDEIAHQLGLDPLEFRRKNLRDERLRAVLDAAAERFGWGGPKSGEGRGVGLACGTEKGGYVATCVEVKIEGRRREVKLVRAVTAFECGAIINPTHLENQVMGAVVQGIGGALYEAIRFADGRLKNPRFSRYRLPRFPDTPPVEVVLINRPDLDSAGAGESPIVAIAPAIANAIFDATGIRFRAMPLAPNGLGPA